MDRRSLLSGAGAAALLPLLPACVPKEELHTNALTPPASVVAQRALQTRRFDTQDDTALLQATVGVLQDLGFTITESRAAGGLVTGTKDRDAVEAGQVAAQVILAILAAAAGSRTHRMVMDRDQRIRVLVVVRPTQDRRASTARVTFQRVVMNTDNQVSRTETLDDPVLYQRFFEHLAQSSFLTAHEI
ncbi:hypothetical protein M0638_27895 [Roseomonas sp. NAR14]|uniref:Uncharacterized protein n=1 Tax=Roseomonas acroporae TaxID=2937791 RepID=A0A9X1YLJ1_9PROT|nr:hypothetical protein [Roseomonas acroporae]MCK8788176.1 hypothetical protein [Roseomonas acroporae]